jgi:integrase
MTKEEYAQVFAKRTSNLSKAKRAFLNTIEEAAWDVIRSLGDGFSFELFEKSFSAKKIDVTDVFASMKARAQELRLEGRIGHANGFDFAAKSLEKFAGTPTLAFGNITVDFLKRYEKWMLTEPRVKDSEKTHSLTTVGMYLRNLRAVYRQAEQNGNIKTGHYPFGDGRYVIPTGRNIKKALTLQEVRLIADYNAVPGSIEQKYQDYWLFSYLCNGINIKDMARLTYANIQGDTIVLNRVKTERERRKQPRPITIIITKTIDTIIKRWGNKPDNTDQYVFPIFTTDMTIEQQYKQSLLTIRQINKYIRLIAAKAKVKIDVTTYTARHSFATVLKRSGASIEFISEQLGHSNIKTTDSYLSDFETDEKRKWANMLLPEINNEN